MNRDGMRVWSSIPSTVSHTGVVVGGKRVVVVNSPGDVVLVVLSVVVVVSGTKTWEGNRL